MDRFTNERHSTTIGTIGLPRLARALLTLIGSCRIYYVFNIKARSPFALHLIKIRSCVIFSWFRFSSYFNVDRRLPFRLVS